MVFNKIKYKYKINFSQTTLCVNNKHEFQFLEVTSSCELSPAAKYLIYCFWHVNAIINVWYEFKIWKLNILFCNSLSEIFMLLNTIKNLRMCFIYINGTAIKDFKMIQKCIQNLWH